MIDAICGSTDLLLFDIEKLITRIDMDPAQFSWVSKQTCQEELGRLSNEQFLDYCLLLGSQFLPRFPIFDNPAFPAKTPTVRDTLAMFNVAGRSALALCAQFEEDRRVQDVQYTDRYKRALITVKHHVYMDEEGRVGPMDPKNAPNDMHVLIGQRLPEELYFYVSKGIIGPNVLNYLTSGEILISLRLGAEDTEIYRQVVGSTLTPIRSQAICLLADYLHRFYHTKVINVRTWYDEKTSTSIHIKDNLQVKDSVQAWKIRTDQLPEGLKKLQVGHASPPFAPRITYTSPGKYWILQVRYPESEGLGICVQVFEG